MLSNRIGVVANLGRFRKKPRVNIDDLHRLALQEINGMAAQALDGVERRYRRDLREIFAPRVRVTILYETGAA